MHLCHSYKITIAAYSSHFLAKTSRIQRHILGAVGPQCPGVTKGAPKKERERSVGEKRQKEGKKGKREERRRTKREKRGKST